MNRVLLLSVALMLALAAAVLPRRTLDDLAARRAAELLDLPVAPPAPAADAAGSAGPSLPLWRALLASSAFERTDSGPVLRLGAVAADPTIAFLAARGARELLELPCTSGFETKPLWEALLASSAAVRGPSGTSLRVYGVRLQADVAYFPDIDYHLEARLSLVRGLEEIGARPTSPFTVAGELDPVHGGANFLVVQAGETQALEVTIDRDPSTRLRVERTGVPEAPNDDALRLVLVRGLLARASRDADLADLRIEGEEEPVPGGATLRFGRIGDAEYLGATPLGGPQLRVTRPWLAPETIAQVLSPERIVLAGAALLVACLAFVPGGTRRKVAAEIALATGAPATDATTPHS